MEKLYKRSEQLLEELRKRELEGEVWAYKERWAILERRHLTRARAGRGMGFALRWKKERGGSFFAFSNNGRVPFDTYPMFISEPVSFPLPSSVKKSGVLVHDPGGVTHLKNGPQLPDEVVQYRELERRVVLINTKGLKGEYTETLFGYTYDEDGLEYTVWTRKRELLHPLKGNRGKRMVLHPVVAYRLISYLLSSKNRNFKELQFSISENPERDFAPGSLPFDAIGLEMKRRAIFRKGKFSSRSPVNYFRLKPDSPPILCWSNIEMNLPRVSCEDYSIIRKIYIFKNEVALGEEGKIVIQGGIKELLSRIAGKIADGWFIGPPYIKSDYLLLE